jgi:hypothetical protein
VDHRWLADRWPFHAMEEAHLSKLTSTNDVTR